MATHEFVLSLKYWINFNIFLDDCNPLRLWVTKLNLIQKKEVKLTCESTSPEKPNMKKQKLSQNKTSLFK